MENGHEMIRMTILQYITMHNSHSMISRVGWRVWDNQHGHFPQYTAMHNSHSMIARTGQRMDMINITILQHTTMHNSLPMISRAGWRMGMRWSAWPFSNILQCTTHQLWLPEKNKEWTWDDHHDYSPVMQNAQPTHYDCHSRMKNGHKMINTTILQHTTMHNSLPMISRAGWRVWDNQHDYFLQYTAMHNSHSMIAREE